MEVLITGNAGEEIVCSKELMVAVGRKSRLEKLNLGSVGVIEERGIIGINEYMQTNVPHIYAIGDIVGNWQLAHAASAQGINAVDHIAGRRNYTNMDIVPSCVYTCPEISSVGKTEAQAAAEGKSVKCGRFPLVGNSKSIITGENSGFVKIVSDKKPERFWADKWLVPGRRN